jgi:two-component system sensor histidine kinase CreC
MKIRARIFLAILLTMGIGFSVLVHWLISDLEPQFRKSTEEPQVDSALVLAAIASTQVENGVVNTVLFRKALENISPEITPVRIYDFVKTTMDLRIYLTDATGKVVFDSVGHDEGKDYSRWNDVLKTLRGEYGTRTSHDQELSVMYVAAPIMADKKIVGALSVGKPTNNVNVFVEKSRKKIILGALFTFGVVVVTTLVISAMITRPIDRLTTYARSVGQGKRASLPDLGKSEMATLGKAFEEMRAALEGKQYVENYIQTLTHEMKSPIAAIQGAAELLKEEMPPERRKKFLENVESETERIRQLIERLLLLSSVENRQTLEKVEDIDLSALAKEVAALFVPLSMAREVAVEIIGEEPTFIRGELFLVRQAVANLMQNAFDFSPRHSTIVIKVGHINNTVQLTVKDHGPGVPDYALSQIFTRFYSLKRPDTGKKSTGIGLSLVSEAMLLHGGSATLENLPEGGASATITFPFR